MVWAKTDSGTWRDEYDGAEKVFYQMSQAFKRHYREHGSVYAICRVRTSSGPGPLLGEQLMQAWTRLRFDFPGLAVFEDGGKKTYLEATAANVKSWINDTFWVDDEADAARHVATGLHLRKLPCLVFVSRSSEVLFHCSHWRIDALGTCVVLDRLFSILAQLTEGTVPGALESICWELEREHLPVSLEDAYGSAKEPTPKTEAKAEEIRQRNFITAYPTAGLPYQGDKSDLPRASRCQTVTFSKDQSEQFIQACKARGFTVTAAVHAACAASVLDSITYTLQRSDDFGSWCRQLTSGYRGDWDPPAYMDALRSIYRIHGETLADLAASGARPPASNVTVSSLGVIDHKYLRADHGVVQVEAFHLGSTIMGRQPTLYIWTFRGCLTLSVDFNEAYYSLGQISTLLDNIASCLSKEMGVDMSRSREGYQ
ncbi:predicted protein [Chaetomium globosum CBS 148.51]|uniref:Acetyltransferase ccdC n=1 Tax=Chaetomium globosum (strain ATCC 6205 / CBS 148.51 / DSM 1962 / NBRC 6347 / NRRL 1970) TaxID=306901 RepID=CCDC_CHAGB|nr:uncharacterized protein CHGG_10018 [Chaetomium globosum CBS 148.51]EAQ83614.1 predicted protein [Chaetomium globosum CBS 148.51]